MCPQLYVVCSLANIHRKQEKSNPKMEERGNAKRAHQKSAEVGKLAQQGIYSASLVGSKVTFEAPRLAKESAW